MTERIRKYRAWHEKEKVMGEVIVVNTQLPAAFVKGVKPGEDVVLANGFVQHAPQDGRLCYLTEIYLMEWTGQDDMDGVGIYEDDILHGQGSKLWFKVEWLDAAFCLVPIHAHDEEVAKHWGFGTSNVKVMPLHSMLCASKEGLSGLKVIGNIHQNPELLV